MEKRLCRPLADVVQHLHYKDDSILNSRLLLSAPFLPPTNFLATSYTVVWVVLIRGSLRAVKWSLTGQDCLTDLGKACSERKYHRKELPKISWVLPHLSSGLDIREGTPEHSYNFPLHHILLFSIWTFSPRWKPIACYFYTLQRNIMVGHNLRSGEVHLVAVGGRVPRNSKMSECFISVAFLHPRVSRALFPEAGWNAFKTSTPVCYCFLLPPRDSWRPPRPVPRAVLVKVSRCKSCAGGAHETGNALWRHLRDRIMTWQENIFW